MSVLIKLSSWNCDVFFISFWVVPPSLVTKRWILHGILGQNVIIQHRHIDTALCFHTITTWENLTSSPHSSMQSVSSQWNTKGPPLHQHLLFPTLEESSGPTHRETAIPCSEDNKSEWNEAQGSRGTSTNPALMVLSSQNSHVYFKCKTTPKHIIAIQSSGSSPEIQAAIWHISKGHHSQLSKWMAPPGLVQQSDAVGRIWHS